MSEAEVYGSTMVTKEDCTNHVAKRLGTALRKLRCHHHMGEKLGDMVIQKLQNYYQAGMTNNRGSVHGMYCAIWASYLHSCSTNDASSHKFCPDGKELWCKHKRAQALQEPTPEYTPLMTKAQRKAVLAIYKCLTDAKPLARCLRRKTQNAAETRFASWTGVETVTAITVLWYNRGPSSFEQVLEELRVFPSKQLVRPEEGQEDDQQADS